MSLPVRRTQAAPWLKDALWRKAQAVPSLDLRFADNKSLVDSVSGQNLITFSRASGGTYIDSTGTLQTAATNAPRFDHNPLTGESLGLLVEEPRTNSIRNNTMVGAVAGTPGTLPTNWSTFSGLTGLTRQIVGTGVDNGISYIDVRLSGTPSAAGTYALYSEASPTSIAAVTGQIWAHSGYFALAAGTITGVTGIRQVLIEYTAVGNYVTQKNSSILVPTSTGLNLNRTIQIATLSGGATVASIQPLVEFVLTGVAIDITLRIGLPQLEQGAFASSVIPTTTAAATRSADVVSITGSAFSSWYRQNEGSVFVSIALLASVNTYQASFTDNTNNNHHFLRYVSTQHQVASTAGGAVNTNIFADSGGSLLTARTAYAYGSGAYSVSTMGGLGAFSSTTGGIPSTIDRLIIGGSQLSGAPGNLTIKRLTFFPARLPNTTLQRLTQ